MNQNDIYGVCKCCQVNPAFFDDGFCHKCFNFMMDGNNLHPNDLIMMVSSALHYREKNDKTDLAKKETKNMKRGMISWAYGDSKADSIDAQIIHELKNSIDIMKPNMVKISELLEQRTKTRHGMMMG